MTTLQIIIVEQEINFRILINTVKALSEYH